MSKVNRVGSYLRPTKYWKILSLLHAAAVLHQQFSTIFMLKIFMTSNLLFYYSLMYEVSNPDRVRVESMIQALSL